MNLKPLLGAACAMICVACSNHKPTVPSFITENVEFAKAQLGLAIDTIEASGKCLNPVTLNRDGSVYYCGYADWRSGFFPGSIWYLYELTGDTSYLPLARKYTEAIRPAEHLTWHHDIGHIIYCLNYISFRIVLSACPLILSSQTSPPPFLLSYTSLYIGLQAKSINI